MRTAAGLQAGQTRRHFLEKAKHPGSTQLPVEDWGASGAGAMNLKNLFGQIQTDGANLFNGTAPCIVEFANVIVLNKIDAASPNQFAAARAIIRWLNADAKIIETSGARVPLAGILDTGIPAASASRPRTVVPSGLWN